MKRPSIFLNPGQSLLAAVRYGISHKPPLSRAGAGRGFQEMNVGSEFPLVDSAGVPKFPQPFAAISRYDQVALTYQ